MSFSYRRTLMAQALSIVGEAGVDGMEYNHIIESMSVTQRRSGRMRWSLVGPHTFPPKEFEAYMKLAWRFGYVERSRYSEWPLAHEKNKSSYAVDDEIVKLTQSGWEYVDKYDHPILHRWGANIVENVPTIIISVTGFIAGRLLLQLAGIIE